MMGKDRETSGQISIDFLVGMSLFLLTLVFLVQFIPAIFAPFDSNSIDLGSVAYRTSVILVEDTGCWNNSATMRTESDWENHVSSTTRVGLAIDKDHPNILNLTKIEAFADTVNLPDLNLSQNLVLFRKIGGNDIFYGWNITLTDSRGNTWMRGEVPPRSGNVARIERLTLINTSEYGWIDADELSGATSGGGPVKPLIMIPNSSVTEFCNDDMEFFITNFNITGAAKYLTTKMVQSNFSNEPGDGLNNTANGLHLNDSHPTFIQLDQSSDGYTELNEVYQGDLVNNVDIDYSTDILHIVINKSAFTRAGFDINNPVSDDVFIEFNFKKIDCNEEHTPSNLTRYNDTLQNVHRRSNLEVWVW